MFGSFSASQTYADTQNPGEHAEGPTHGLTIFSFLTQQKGSRSDNSKSNKIFVGGIPHNCGETELREYFKKFGVVSSSLTASTQAAAAQLDLVETGTVEPFVLGRLSLTALSSCPASFQNRIPRTPFFPFTAIYRPGE